MIQTYAPEVRSGSWRIVLPSFRANIMGASPAAAEQGQAFPAANASIILHSLQEKLQTLSACIAKEFLAVGAALQSISTRTREITALSQSAARLSSTAESEKTIETLHDILADTERVQDLAETSQIQMPQILACLEHSRSPLALLAKLPYLLNAVGMLSRIESGRLKDTAVDISSLAADIENLKKQVEGNVNGIVKSAETLTLMVADTVHQLNTMKEEEREQARSLVEQARAVMESLQARAQSAKAAAAQIDEQYSAIRGASDKIVMSLQSEDMARQRVEHIQHALQQAALAAEAGEPPENYLSILALQRLQLVSTRDFLAHAIQSLSENLHSLSPRVQSLTNETSALASETDRNGHSIATAIEEGLGAVAAVFGRFSVSARAIVATVENVLPALESMTKGAKELAEIEVSIQIIAINASVKTSQLRDRGATISVLAGELQNVNALSGSQTRTVLESLSGIDRALGALSNHGMTENSRVLKIDAAKEVNAEVSALSASVLRSSQELAASLSALLEMSRALGGEIESACQVANAAAATSESFDSILRTLDFNFEQLGGVGSAELESAIKEKMVTLASMYSMESEREVHQKLFNQPAANAGPEATSDAGDLGDNTELF